MFWLNGMAGTGKSTIARTVAQSFKDKEQLGATFFFKRGEGGRGNARYLVSTITRQLVATYRQLAPDVLAAIENDPNISSRNLSEQFNKLLLQPLGRLRSNRPTTIMMVIDALDECTAREENRVGEAPGSGHTDFLGNCHDIRRRSRPSSKRLCWDRGAVLSLFGLSSHHYYQMNVQYATPIFMDSLGLPTR
jgi:hypothetical protein